MPLNNVREAAKTDDSSALPLAVCPMYAAHRKSVRHTMMNTTKYFAIIDGYHNAIAAVSSTFLMQSNTKYNNIIYLVVDTNSHCQISFIIFFNGT